MTNRGRKRPLFFGTSVGQSVSWIELSTALWPFGFGHLREFF